MVASVNGGGVGDHTNLGVPESGAGFGVMSRVAQIPLGLVLRHSPSRLGCQDRWGRGVGDDCKQPSRTVQMGPAQADSPSDE